MADKTNAFSFQIEDRVVVSQEGVSQDPVVRRTKRHDGDVASTSESDDVLLRWQLVGVCLAQSNVDGREV